MSIEGD